MKLSIFFFAVQVLTVAAAAAAATTVVVQSSDMDEGGSDFTADVVTAAVSTNHLRGGGGGGVHDHDHHDRPTRRYLGGQNNNNGVGANQGSARQTPRGKKVECDDSDFIIPGQTKTLAEIGSEALCGQQVTSCLWYIGLREIDCECGFDVPCPTEGDEFCFDGTTLTNGIGGGAKSDGSNGLRFWVCDLDES